MWLLLFVWNTLTVSLTVSTTIGVRANIHLGGQTEFCPNGFGGGGGSSSRNFPGSIFSGGGGVVAEIVRALFGEGGGSGRTFSVNSSNRG